MKKRKTVRLVILIIITVLAIAGAIFVTCYKNRLSPGYPEIKFNSDSIKASITATDEELLRGVTATDPEDGGITSSLIVEGTTNLIKGNQIKVTYAAFDSQNHVTKAERTVEYTDYESPSFEMTQPLIFKLSNDINVLSCIRANDVFDGDISRNIKYTIVNNGVSFEQVGEYGIEVSVTNKIGDTVTIPLTVEITDGEANPAQIMLSDYLVYIEKDSEFNPADYVVSYLVGGKETTDTKDITINSDVDTATPGIYTAEYSYTAKNSEITSHTRLVVVVK